MLTIDKRIKKKEDNSLKIKLVLHQTNIIRNLISTLFFLLNRTGL